jgi:hypothetical protein
MYDFLSLSYHASKTLGNIREKLSNEIQTLKIQIKAQEREWSQKHFEAESDWKSRNSTLQVENVSLKVFSFKRTNTNSLIHNLAKCPRT